MFVLRNFPLKFTDLAFARQVSEGGLASRGLNQIGREIGGFDLEIEAFLAGQCLLDQHGILDLVRFHPNAAGLAPDARIVVRLDQGFGIGEPLQRRVFVDVVRLRRPYQPPVIESGAFFFVELGDR